MASIRVITFDLDNTLWDVEPALRRAEAAQRRWLLEHRPGAIDEVDDDTLWDIKKRLYKTHRELAHSVGAMRRLMLDELQQQAGYSPGATRSGTEQAFEVFLSERQQVQLYDDVLPVLEALANRYRLGALTNGNADVFKTEAAEYFEFAFLAEDVGASKPDPALFQAALRTTNARPEEVVHVGDNHAHDVRGAQNAGMRSVWLNAAQQSESDNMAGTLRDAPDATITAISQLPVAIANIEAGVVSG